MKKFKDVLNEVAPAGWEGTVKAMKKNKDIDNPWALAWYMKNKGYSSHEARQAIKSGYWPKGYKTSERALERKKARAGKAERIGKVVDVTTVEDAPANSTADVAMRPTMLFKRKKKDVNEALFKAKVVGLDPIYVEKKSAGEVKTALRKALKNPKDIEYVEKISKTEYKKDVLKRFSGKDDEDTKEESIGRTAGDKSHYYLQKAKQLAKKDRLNYDKLPQYDRRNNKHKDYYDAKARKEEVDEKLAVSVDEDEIEESRFEVAIKGFPWHVYVDANNPSQVKKDMGKMLRPGYSITTIHMAR